MKRVLLFWSVALFVVATGCATAPPLRTEGSSSAIRAAEEVGAKDVPQAALHVQLAKESMDKATKLYAKGEKAQAKSLLTRAEADGELAVLLSRENSEKQDAAKAVERVRQLGLDNPERSIP